MADNQTAISFSLASSSSFTAAALIWEMLPLRPE
jgi:hypothetical protein